MSSLSSLSLQSVSDKRLSVTEGKGGGGEQKKIKTDK